MADILNFEEFEIIETIDYEEEVQRPENLRFFTLDDQLLDYFEKALPTTTEVTKFEKKKIASEIGRLRELYSKKIVVTDTEYKINTERKDIDVPWVTPIYSKFSYIPYSYAESWNPLYTPESTSIPNYYPKMLNALPRPYVSEKGRDIQSTSLLVDDEGKNTIIGLGKYERTKTVIHDDGTFTIEKIPLNIADEIKVKGYFISDRKVDIPNPLAQHEFLSSTEPHAYLTELSLNEIFPSVEAILTHGVPVTSDPYNEGNKYLKVYDLKLSDIPWSLWSKHFPPLEDTTPSAITPISYAKTNEMAPSDSLKESYTPWESGVYPRFWLMKQEDAGVYMVKMLLSTVGEAGNVPPAVPIEALVPSFPPSTPDSCLVTTTFPEFLSSGIFRSPTYKEIEKAEKDKKPYPSGLCIPTSFIQQERAKAIVGNKIAWKETTGREILVEHKKLLDSFKYSPLQTASPLYEKFVGKPESDLRPSIRAILVDEKLTSDDKIGAIKAVVKDLEETKVYVDTSGSFVVCSHTIADLEGEMLRNRLKFYKDWTAIVEGFRVCKFCGEQINTDVVGFQEDFDDQGNPIITHDKIGEERFHGDPNAYKVSMDSIVKHLNLKNSGELTLYLLLCLLQVIPNEIQIKPIIQTIKTISASLKRQIKDDRQAHYLEGITGIAGMVILLQIHDPFLIPRRSFGSKVLKLSGFPRDTDDSNDSPIIDMLISILKKTIESAPNTYQGPITALFEQIFSKTKSVRSNVIAMIKKFDSFKAELESSKARYQAVPEVKSINEIFLPLIVVKKDSFNPSERLSEELMGECKIPAPYSFITGLTPPSLTQSPVILDKTLPAKDSKLIPKISFESVKIELTKQDVQKFIELGFPKNPKLNKLKSFSDESGVSTLSLVSQLLNFVSDEDFVREYRSLIVYLQPIASLRDTALGIFYKVLHQINKEPGDVIAVANALNTNLALQMILLTKIEAEEQSMELRAKERDFLKRKLRQMDDTQREITKMLLTLGFGEIIGKEDRDLFYTESKAQGYELPPDPDRPEEGYYANADNDRDALEVTEDAGNYGDNRLELYDRGDYGSGTIADDDGF